MSQPPHEPDNMPDVGIKRLQSDCEAGSLDPKIKIEPDVKRQKLDVEITAQVKQPLNIVNIDPRGDLTINLRSEDVGFKVDSNTLKRTAPILYQKCLAVRPVDCSAWTLELRTTTIEAAEVFFNVIHGNVDRVPECMDATMVYEILDFTIHYGMRDRFLSSLKRWFHAITITGSSKERERLNCCRLWIARGLGLNDPFNNLQQWAVFNLKADDNGMVGVDGESRGFYNLSRFTLCDRVVSDRINQLRSEAITLILKNLKEAQIALVPFGAFGRDGRIHFKFGGYGCQNCLDLWFLCLGKSLIRPKWLNSSTWQGFPSLFSVIEAKQYHRTLEELCAFIEAVQKKIDCFKACDRMGIEACLPPRLLGRDTVQNLDRVELDGRPWRTLYAENMSWHIQLIVEVDNTQLNFPESGGMSAGLGATFEALNSVKVNSTLLRRFDKMDTSPPKKKAKLEDDRVTTGLDTKNNPIHIDPNGNLKLIVGPAAVPMHVDANALRRSSKVFDRMLFGDFSESYQTDGWAVELPEDDPEALRVIFHAAHANFRDLPPTLSLSQLYYITVMADKYGMIGTLQPWMANWTSAETHPELWTSEDENETSREDLQRLCVLYYQGLPQQFYEILLRVLIKTKSNSSCKLLYSAGFAGDGKGSSSDSHEWADFTLLPFGLLSLDTVFKSCTEKDSGPSLNRRCRATALGLMIQHLVQKKLWPIPLDSEVCLSVAQLSHIANDVRSQLQSSIVQDCKCISGIRGLSPCDLTLPLVFNGPWRQMVEKAIPTRFDLHFAELAENGIGPMKHQNA
ncbi:hypothetical protein J7T55_002868 [Diaporthe amygdali]|uniref:uncharacterized protein n=1 Tax=Phomopsis amygdali TaxID=1214568 RepID=UPI0022FE25EE|nr:uncharacterized protein J7T55_002868 [Diaporthe amygdali]KAJ0122355.1 hypothetical protein J7T55_002868 [Diaporthe amygdali]